MSHLLELAVQHGSTLHPLRAKRLGIDTQHEPIVLTHVNCPVARSEGFSARAKVELSAARTADAYGMRSRSRSLAANAGVEVARVVAADPAIILLDEPFTGIDPLSIADLKVMITALKARDIGVLITDHNVHAMLELVDRAYNHL